MEHRVRALWMMGDAGPLRAIPSMDRLGDRMRDGVGLVLLGRERCEGRDCEVVDPLMVRVVGFGLERGFVVGLGCFCLNGVLLGVLVRRSLFEVNVLRCLVLSYSSRLFLGVDLGEGSVLVDLHRHLKTGKESGVQVSRCGFGEEVDHHVQRG